MNNDCHTTDALLDPGTGEVTGLDQEALYAHVETCTDCQAKFSTVDDQFTDLIRLLRHERNSIEPHSDSGWIRVESVLKKIHQQAQETPVDEELPEVIRGCQILGRLGAGGMGQVYRAFHSELKREVALKVLPRERLSDEIAVQRFRREMEAIGRLDHTNVIRALNAGQDGDSLYIVTELISGLDLSKLVRTVGPIPEGIACELIRQAALGLQHIHDHGLIHRDVKPSNLMVTTDGTVKILDLGLSRITGSNHIDATELTVANQIMGTIDYMAPEQGEGASGVSIQSDLYSLGATLYKLLTGVTPTFRNTPQSLMERIRKISTGELIPVEQRTPEVSGELAVIVNRMLEHSPEDRYSHPADVATKLKPLSASGELVQLVQSALERSGKESSEKEAVFDDIDLQLDRIKKTSNKKLIRNVIGLALACFMLVVIAFSSLSSRDDPVQDHVTPERQSPNTIGQALITGENRTHPDVPRTSKPLRRLSGHQDAIKDLLVLPDGHRVVSVGFDSSIRMFDLHTAEEIWVSHPRRQWDFLTCLDISHDGNVIAAGGIGDVVNLFETETGRLVREVSVKDVSAGINHVTITSDDRSILVSLRDASVVLVEIESGKTIRRFTEPVEGVDLVMQGFALAPDGNSFVVPLPDLELVQIDLHSGERIMNYNVHQSKWVDFVFKKDGTRLVGAGNNNLAIWETETGEQIWAMNTGTRRIHRIRACPNEHYLFIGVEDRTIQVVDLLTGELVHIYEAETHSTHLLDLSSDGTRLVSGAGWYLTNKLFRESEFKLNVWDTTQFAPEHAASPHP